MASSSSTFGNWKYHVFPSFRGEDVRYSFLSHLLRELERKLITTFIDHGIERSLPVGPELLLAIKESRIAIVIFSKNYAASTWCLNELVEIHKCWKESDQMVIPIFYDVEPSHVRWQDGEFGNRFKETCDGKTNDVKQRWMQALTDVANLAGEDSKNWRDKGEAKMIEHIAKDVFNKIKKASSDLNDFVGIESHFKRLDTILCLKSEEVRIVGIVGPPGIGKSTIGRALFSQISSRFHHHAFVHYKRTTHMDDYGKKLRWEEQLLSEIQCQKNIKISHLGVVEQMLMHKKVLIIVDDLDDLILNTLVGQTRFVGSGSRIIVITQDRKLLKSHKIDLIYEVEFPSEDLALQMFCRSAFDQNSPPDGFMDLAFEVAYLSGNLPLGLSVLGSSLRGMDKKEWVEMLPRLQNSLDGKIEKTLRVSYDRLEGKDQDLFLSIACLFNGNKVNHIESLLGDSDKFGLRMLADKSLIRITPSDKTVLMHSLLQKLGKEIVRAEFFNNPGERRFLTDAEEICDVLTDITGTENVQAIHLNTSEIKEPLFIDEKSFKGMRNLKFLKFYKNGEGRLYLPRDLVRFPRKLRLLHWDQYPSKCMPFNFRGEYLVKLKMKESKLEKLWEGTQFLQNLKEMDMSLSANLKKIPDLSKAINLEELILKECTSIVTLPSSIGNLNNLHKLNMQGCSNLRVLPADVNLESLEILDLRRCSQLRTFPRISRNISQLYLSENALEGEEDCSWIENITHLTILHWDGVPLSCMPLNFCPESLTQLKMRGGRLEKLWGGVKSLEKLKEVDLSGCENLVEIPDLSKATNLGELKLKDCNSLAVLPSSIGNLNNLWKLSMSGCENMVKIPDLATNLEELRLKDCKSLVVLPSSIGNLNNLWKLGMSGCENMVKIPDLATNLEELTVADCNSLVMLPSSIGNLNKLEILNMLRCENLVEIPDLSGATNLEKLNVEDCNSLVVLPSSIGNLNKLEILSMSGCENLVEIPDLSGATNLEVLDLGDCKSLVVLPSSIGNLINLKGLNVNGCENLVEIPDLSRATNLKVLDLGDCKSLVVLPSSIGNLINLKGLGVKGCENLVEIPDLSGATNLKVLDLGDCKSLVVLPSSIGNLINLKGLNVNGCENLVEIPDLSKATNLEFLYLEDCKSLVVLPSSIGNLNKLRKLSMSGCTMLEVLPTDINLERLVDLDLRGCSKLRKFPRISTNIMYLHLDDTAIEEVPSWIKNMFRLNKLTMSGCKKLRIISPTSSFNMPQEPSLAFNNCFNLDRDAQKVIIQSWLYRVVLPGGEVPMYFTHKACGSSLSMLLSERDLSEKRVGFKACIVVGPTTHSDVLVEIKVQWCFRGKEGFIRVHIDLASCERDHLVMFLFRLPIEKVKKSPSVLNNDVLLLEFFARRPVYDKEEYFLLPQQIKRCGVRIVNISPRRFLWSELYGNLETNAEESDEESDRSKKKMRMTVATSQEPSNSPCVQTAVNSWLQIKMPSPAKIFHGDDGASPSLSITPSDPYLGGESLYFDPMIID